MSDAIVDCFADWANSIAALAVAPPNERINMVRVNEITTARAMAAWQRDGERYEMKKPNRVWVVK